MRKAMRRGLAAAALVSTFVASAAPVIAWADEFPSRPITIMVGLAPGGITDVTTRIYAEVVARNIGQRVIVENRAGAGGGIAAAAVQNAAPDGHTLLVFSGSQHATVPLSGGAGYDPVK